MFLAIHGIIIQLIHPGMLVASSTRFATGFMHKNMFRWEKNDP